MTEKDGLKKINNEVVTSKSKKRSVKDKLREFLDKEITRFKEGLTTENSQLRETMENKEEKLLQLLLKITSIVVLLYVLIRFLF